MKTTKLSLANVQGKLSRSEMKNIMAGKNALPTCNCNSSDDCTTWNESCMASCEGGTGAGHCGCVSATSVLL